MPTLITKYGDRCKYAVKRGPLAQWNDCNETAKHKVGDEYFCADHADQMLLAVR